ncbi:hypothetical protein THIOM_001777 [Candidatus Thiomargarita nelsonii]|uniref:Uncharacterized protein n=1 Tax=Candidatus Thiomargarita nelsonii TaxID=1003181 RepID=A0A176S2U8_9GAMM|nr:hypothetical protein THIOM_001777 [Candidatus Thiomargarita nelsonii]
MICLIVCLVGVQDLSWASKIYLGRQGHWIYDLIWGSTSRALKIAVFLILESRFM